ncbi:hypothetical protein [Haloplanus pelagicus]|jgi:hypothetical protein|uniref:hypothetical protein n=1 Tax=Haloplanus pelagicus TaxID=2949995 RepID=UPI00203EB467|nr:hypothetical protein [Haloplanus sp. HW8-1]
MTDLDGITVVTEPSEESLNERQLSDYRSQREDCLKWLLTFGKNPDKVEGYAFETVRIGWTCSIGGSGSKRDDTSLI